MTSSQRGDSGTKATSTDSSAGTANSAASGAW